MSSEDRKLAGSAIVVLAVIALELAWFVVIGPPGNSTNHAAKKEAENLFLGLSAEAWTAIFTGVLTISTIGLWVTTRTASLAAEKAANAAIAGQRAWLAIRDVKLLHPTSFKEEGATLRLQITTRNFGQSPATSTYVDAASVYLGAGNEAKVREEFVKKMRAHPAMLGHAIFPDEDDFIEQTLTWSDAPEKIKPSIKTQPTGQKTINLSILVAVSYRIAGIPEPRITYQPYSMLNIPIGMTVLKGESYEIPVEPFLAGITD